MEKERLIEAINQKGLSNSLISIYYNIGRALPFVAQRFPDGRVSDWYRNQYVEVHEVKPGGKGGKYGNAYGFYYRNGERADAWEDDPELSWCKKDDTVPQKIPSAACGSWVLLDILGEATAEPTKIYGLDDVLEIGKYKGKTLKEVVHSDWGWVKWASMNTEHFFFDVDAVIEEKKKAIKVLHPEDVLTFGKYKGQTVRYIADNDMNYLRWLDNSSEDFTISFEELLGSKQQLKEVIKQNSLLSDMGSGLLSYLKGYGVIFGVEQRSNLAPLSFTQTSFFNEAKSTKILPKSGNKLEITY